MNYTYFCRYLPLWTRVMFKVGFLVIFVILNIFSASKVAAEQSEIIKISTPLQGKKLFAIRERIRKSYADIGYKTEIIKMPAKRALYEAMHNPEIDAELMRVLGVESVLTDYIRIPIPLITMYINAYSYSDIENKLTWDSLSKYRPVTVRGLIVIERKFQELNVDYDTVNTVEQAMEMIQLKRADIAVLPKALADDIINTKKNVEQPKTNDVLQTMPIFHSLHSRHIAIAPALEESIKNNFELQQ